MLLVQAGCTQYMNFFSFRQKKVSISVLLAIVCTYASSWETSVLRTKFVVSSSDNETGLYQFLKNGQASTDEERLNCTWLSVGADLLSLPMEYRKGGVLYVVLELEEPVVVAVDDIYVLRVIQNVEFYNVKSGQLVREASFSEEYEVTDLDQRNLRVLESSGYDSGNELLEKSLHSVWRVAFLNWLQDTMVRFYE